MNLNDEGKQNIELVETNVEAGYLTEFANPVFLSEMPKISFPFAKNGLFRAFEILGNSMLPIESGGIVVCKYIESLSEIKVFITYKIITQRYKVVFRRLKWSVNNKLLCSISDNEIYELYFIHLNEVKEIWKLYVFIGFNDLKATFKIMNDNALTQINLKVTSLYNKWI